MGALSRRALSEAWGHLISLAQFAYTNGRGSHEAIGRVLDMVDTVFSQALTKHYNSMQLINHCLIASLDLTNQELLIMSTEVVFIKL